MYFIFCVRYMHNLVVGPKLTIFIRFGSLYMNTNLFKSVIYIHYTKLKDFKYLAESVV